MFFFIHFWMPIILFLRFLWLIDDENSFLGLNVSSAYGLISRNTICKTRKTDDRLDVMINYGECLSKIVLPCST
jgi:hypothetical protein